MSPSETRQNEEKQQSKSLAGSGLPSGPGAVQEVKQRIRSALHAIAGSLAGGLSTVFLHPLDTLKTRMQAHEGRFLAAAETSTSQLSSSSVPTAASRQAYATASSTFRTIWRTEGWRAFYQGLTPTMLGSGFSWGFYFFAYDTAKQAMQDHFKKERLGPGFHLLAAAQAGVCTSLMTNPIWVVKTRMFDAFRKIVKYEGIKGLYTGIVPALMLVSHGAVQFMVYEELKYWISTRKEGEKVSPTGPEYLAAAATSKVFATSVTYPLQVIKTRLQDQMNQARKAAGGGSENNAYRGTVDTAKRIFMHEGVRGFYRGLLPNILRVTPQSSITLFTYEVIVKYMDKLST